MKLIQTTILAAILAMFGASAMATENNTAGVKKSVEKKNEQISKANASGASKAKKAKKSHASGEKAAEQVGH
ncbi:hypothetical protein [Chitinibacter tainanensis]|jgi:beta-lactamase regulating signal transducer with metallopeptidase domain|uniref:hypothetical protein n=1 Tax=Chitinibacter tainanensis TaxID=230667 RepID=UPI002356A90D|nr:hypothetical protein [Chitinibacter tainanensis]